jgi:uncharacterized repeat protein (TIGR01451 family)
MNLRWPGLALLSCAMLALLGANPTEAAHPDSSGAVATVPRLSLELSHNPPTVQVGHELTLTDKVIAGPDTIQNAVLTDTLPNEFTFLNGSAPGGACTVNTSGFFPIVTCPLGTISSGTAVTATLTVRPEAVGGYTNNAKAKGFDGALPGTVFSDEWTDLLTVDPPLPSLSIDDVSKNEGDSGTTAFDFTVSLSGPSTSGVTVDYASADGTANAPGDYQAATGSLTFAAGETSKTVTLQVNGDTSVEPDETFAVNLSNASGATIASGTGTGTIANDDSAPPATACLTVSPSGAIDFGTGMLSKSGATVKLSGDQAVTVTNCGTKAETISVHGTDATATGATWRLVGGDPCASGTNEFGLALADASGDLRVGSSDTTVATVAPGQSLSRRPEILMACTGSEGAGKTLTTQLVFTATL